MSKINIPGCQPVFEYEDSDGYNDIIVYVTPSQKEFTEGLRDYNGIRNTLSVLQVQQAQTMNITDIIDVTEKDKPFYIKALKMNGFELILTALSRSRDL